jgi:hypothetical protein
MAGLGKGHLKPSIGAQPWCKHKLHIHSNYWTHQLLLDSNVNVISQCHFFLHQGMAKAESFTHACFAPGMVFKKNSVEFN